MTTPVILVSNSMLKVNIKEILYKNSVDLQTVVFYIILDTVFALRMEIIGELSLLHNPGLTRVSEYPRSGNTFCTGYKVNLLYSIKILC